MKSKVTKFQIGKNGPTQGAIESLKLNLKNHKQIRISVLKSSGRDKKKMLDIVNELQEKIPARCNYRIIGFTIIISKLGK